MGSFATVAFSFPIRQKYPGAHRIFLQSQRCFSLCLIRLTAPDGATQSPHDDILEELVAQKTFEDLVTLLRNCGPRSQIDFPLERWTISLALCFEGLLGDTYMPFPLRSWWFDYELLIDHCTSSVL